MTAVSRRLLLGTTLATPALAAQKRERRARHKADEIPPGPPAVTPVGDVASAAKFAIVTDYTSGATLLDKDADDEMAPSSMTKMMTAYLVYGALRDQKLKLTDMLPVSDKAWRMGGSKMFVPQGGAVGVEDLIRGLIVQSGNDAAIVLAEGVSGSEEAFAEVMTARARELGMSKTTFRNATGWPDATHKSSCRDLCTLAAHLIRDFPEYYHYDNEKSFKYNGIEQENRNPLVQRGAADGLKTGHTEEGGFGLCASSERNGRRIVMVLNGMSSARQRAEEGERMLEWAFREFEDVTLFTAGDTVDHLPVYLGTDRTVPLVGGRDLVVTMPRDWRGKAKIAIRYDGPLVAPVSRGDVVARLVTTGQGVPALDIPLYAGADVARLGLPGRAIAVLTHVVTGS